jgi:hypothetical protein
VEVTRRKYAQLKTVGIIIRSQAITRCETVLYLRQTPNPTTINIASKINAPYVRWLKLGSVAKRVGKVTIAKNPEDKKNIDQETNNRIIIFCFSWSRIMDKCTQKLRLLSIDNLPFLNTRCCVITTLNTAIGTLQKHSQFKEAILYHTIIQITRLTIADAYPQFREDWKQLKVYYKNTTDTMIIKFTSHDLSFLSFIKTELHNINSIFTHALTEKSLLQPHQQLAILCLTR